MLTGLASAAGGRFGERWDEHSGRGGQAQHRGGCTLSRSRRRLPGTALIEFDVGLGLAEEVPIRHRLGSLLPGGWPAGGRDRGRPWRLTDVVENPPDGGRRRPRCAMMRLSAPQFGQVSGSDSNSRASSMAQSPALSLPKGSGPGSARWTPGRQAVRRPRWVHSGRRVRHARRRWPRRAQVSWALRRRDSDGGAAWAAESGLRGGR